MINLVTFELTDAPSLEEGVKLLKTRFRSNKLRFDERFLKPLKSTLSMNNIRNHDKIIQLYSDLFDEYSEYSYTDAFKESNNSFRSQIFSALNVVEMIENLGHQRIKTEGITLNNKTWNDYTKSFENRSVEQVYELHRVNGEKLGLNTPLYAIKCWCTSTNDEHWIWTEEENSPLTAIANTCVIYKSMKNNIKHIIRQGDVFLFEMINPQEVSDDDEKISLSKDEYFSLLKSQS